MGKKKGAENSSTPPSEEKEGHNLLGSPKFKKLDNGRLKCVQIGHELPAHATESYAQSKHCRLGLIDSALARNKPPLNMFQQDPFSRSKLICKLTGDTVNKTEEHIWKHVNGKRFLNMLEKKEAEKEMPNGVTMEQDQEKEMKDKKKKKKKDKKNEDKDLKKKKKKKKMITEEDKVDDITNEVRDPEGNISDMENEAEFWMPSLGERWDHDDGGDRWGSDKESGSESDDVGEKDAGAEEVKHEAAKLSKQTKRMSLEIGHSSFGSKKKKKKTSDE